MKIEKFLKKPFDLVDFEAALCSACAKASRNPGKGEWLPELKLEGVSASKFVRELSETELDGNTKSL